MSEYNHCQSRRWSRWGPIAMALVALVVAGPSSAQCLEPPGDLDASGTTTVSDVICGILTTLWTIGCEAEPPPSCLVVGPEASDLNCDGTTSIVDVQLAIAVAIGSPWSEAVDGVTADYCAEACVADSDGDGTADVEDCAPHDPAIHPGAAETCNHVDDDCNGVIDDHSDAAALVAVCDDGDICTGVPTCIPSPAGVRITEIQAVPAAASGAVGEWIEIANLTGAAVDIEGWTLRDDTGDAHVIAASCNSLVVPPGGFVVLGASTDAQANGGVAVDYAWTSFSLDDLADSVVLDNGIGAEVDRVDYDATFPISPGASLALTSLVADNGLPSSWAASTAALGSTDLASPGAANSDVQGPPPCLPAVPLGCDDGNPCTDDGCHPVGGCTTAFNSGPCDDGDPTTGGDTCSNGVCQGGSALNCFDGIACTTDIELPNGDCQHDPLAGACDDGNPCIVDACDPTAPGAGADGCTHDPLAATGAPCDDGDACTFPDICGLTGTCTGGFPFVCNDGISCTDDVCNGMGGCEFPVSVVCDDGNPCTEEVCSPGGPGADANGCINDPVLAAGSVCDDGEPCTFPDVCGLTGSCVSGFLFDCDDGAACSDDACDGAGGCLYTVAVICDDGNGCTADSCAPGDPAADANGCLSDPLGATGLPCDDGDACTFPDVCGLTGSCVSGFPFVCDDGDPCTNDYCDGSGGCTTAPSPDGAPCDDGDACTAGEECQLGLCEGGATVDCDDGAACTTDGCDPASGCTATPVDSTCTDGNGCTADRCDPTDLGSDSDGCIFDAVGALGLPCDDGDVCTYPDVCGFAGDCVAGFLFDCDDGAACTIDACDGVGGCTHVATTLCDDGNVCTADSCSPGAAGADTDGCVNDPLGATGLSCEDGEPCTFPDICGLTGSCVPGFLFVCDDGDSCSVDACDGSGGCTASPAADGSACEDGNLCTEAETCTSGVCGGGASVDCDDGVLCTIDDCEPASGCTATSADANCTDANPCTLDLCDPGAPGANTDGCLFDALAATGLGCDDGEPCTFPDVCDLTGSCEPGFLFVCDDGDPCTTDACDSVGGCITTPIPNCP